MSTTKKQKKKFIIDEFNYLILWFDSNENAFFANVK